MKGISPMIATILLVAFTVAVGGLISVWMSSFTKNTQSNVEAASYNQTRCSGTYIDVSSVTSTSVIITDRGDQTISNIRCFTSDGTELNFTGTATLQSLTAGQSASKAFTRSSNTSVFCSGTCLSVGVTGECKSTSSCWS